MKNFESNIIQLFSHIVTPERTEFLAKKTGFVSRSTSKFKGPEFVELLTFPTKCNSEESLNGLCDRLRLINKNIDISASALCQRINTVNCTTFMKTVFLETLQKVRSDFVQKSNEFHESYLNNFSKIYIEDSTYISLNKKLRKKYPGTGNLTSSQLKIDFIHDFKGEQIVDLHITRGNLPDQGLAERILDFIKKGELVIRDLGYFKLDVFRSIARKGSFYLSRMLSNVLIYLNPDDLEPLDLESYIETEVRKKKIHDLDVYIGADKLPTRLVMYKLPKKIAKQIAEAEEKKASGHSRKTSVNKTSLMKYGIFITNATREMMPKEVVGTIYRIRWNIELIFKQWKSQLKIHSLEGTNKYRIDSLIYSRLTLILFLSVLMQWAMDRCRKLYGKELSLVKLIQYLNRGERLANALRTGELDKLSKQIKKDMPKRLCKCTRNRLTSRQRVKRNTWYYNDEREKAYLPPNKKQNIRNLGKCAA